MTNRALPLAVGPRTRSYVHGSGGSGFGDNSPFAWVVGKRQAQLAIDFRLIGRVSFFEHSHHVS